MLIEMSFLGLHNLEGFGYFSSKDKNSKIQKFIEKMHKKCCGFVDYFDDQEL
jgi:hypothetical protein